jgi:hypothetical protein
VLNIGQSSSRKVVKQNYLITSGKQAISKMRADKSSSPRDQRPHPLSLATRQSVLVVVDREVVEAACGWSADGGVMSLNNSTLTQGAHLHTDVNNVPEYNN